MNDAPPSPTPPPPDQPPPIPPIPPPRPAPEASSGGHPRREPQPRFRQPSAQAPTPHRQRWPLIAFAYLCVILLGLRLGLMIADDADVALLSWSTGGALVWWMLLDARHRQSGLTQSHGWQAMLVWLPVIPIYAIHARRSRGILGILFFVSAYWAATMLGYGFLLVRR